jgi:hypothetical protein
MSFSCVGTVRSFLSDDFNQDTSLVQGLIHVEFYNLMFSFALIDDLCCVWFMHPILEAAQMSYVLGHYYIKLYKMVF